LDATAVNVWTLSFDEPGKPTETTVTDPLGVVSVYTLGRDVGSSKPRLASLDGSCPSCGLEPNSQLAYEDPAHPLRPTRQTDGDGTVTLLAYDATGQLTSRVDDLGGDLERETTWSYDTDFPSFVTEVRRPSVTGNPLDERVTSIVYDAEGNETSRTESGFEDHTPFSLVTVTTPSAAGRVTSIDPPGHATDDVTSFTHDPARGGLVTATRTDPLVGTTTYGYDTVPAVSCRSSAKPTPCRRLTASARSTSSTVSGAAALGRRAMDR
jgi:YD repeat-containing protein